MKEVKYIFPINYNRAEKIWGIIDYKVIAVMTVWGFILFHILKLSNLSFKLNLYIFLIAFLFPGIIIAVGVDGENMLSFSKHLIKYLIKSKVYVYRK